MRPPPDWPDRLAEDRLLAEFSLWSADLAQLAEEVRRVDPFADLYHVDVADGHFSPTLLFFPDLVASIRRQTAKPVHVHLMADDAILERQITQFASAGTDLISIHAENRKAGEAIELIVKLGLVAGLVLQLHTPVELARPYLASIRHLTLLGTQMGIKGQDLDPAAEGRLRDARRLLGGRGSAAPRVVLAADGAIRDNTVPRLRRAGAEAVVMGSMAFGSDALADRIAWVRAQEPRVTS